jgi:hypothetical protein
MMLDLLPGFLTARKNMKVRYGVLMLGAIVLITIPCSLAQVYRRFGKRIVSIFTVENRKKEAVCLYARLSR